MSKLSTIRAHAMHWSLTLGLTLGQAGVRRSGSAYGLAFSQIASRSSDRPLPQQRP